MNVIRGPSRTSLEGAIWILNNGGSAGGDRLEDINTFGSICVKSRAGALYRLLVTSSLVIAGSSSALVAHFI